MHERILPRIARGELPAMDECLDRYGGLIWSLCRRFDPAHAEDIAQEVLIDLWRNAWRYREDRGSELSFISTLTRRRLIDQRRRVSRVPQLSTLDDIEIASTTSSPIDASLHAELKEQLKQCWGKLSERDREFLNLSVHDGCTQSEIAGKMNTPLGTVKTIIRRALILLRDCVSRSPGRSWAGDHTP
ncbi:MAG: sigma-70 family RNA polymerase sigma factor [Gemmataceae bacterium]